MSNDANRPGPGTSLEKWLAWLETLSPTEIDLGLDRVNAVLGRMKVRRPPRTITVAGTNGKGSSVAMLEALYLQQSASVGAYTSPHIHRFNERIRVAGQEAADCDIVESLATVEAARDGVPLTYFEFTTLCALDLFHRAAVDTVILEVGLGGRLDAVNAVEPDGGIITNIALDHMDWLGNDIESIAAEKAGILRPGKPFVFGANPLPEAIVRRATALGTDLRVLGRDFDFAVDTSGWRFSGRDRVLDDLVLPSLPGRVQLQNAAGVLALLEALGDSELLDARTVNAAFAQLRIDGRCQVLDKQSRWIVDVAHNPAAAAALADSLPDVLRSRPDGGRLCCVLGVLKDKDITGIVEPLLPLVDRWIAVSAAGPRAVAAPELARQIANLADRPCHVVPSIAEGCELAGEQGCDSVLVTGSFMTVGPALDWIYSHAP